MTALGVVLVLIGVIAVAVEAHRPVHGALGGPGGVALAGGAALALAGAGASAVLVAALAAVLTLAAAGVVGFSLRKGVAVRRRRIRSGAEALIGRIGEVRSWEARDGRVWVDGALWRARVDESLEDSSALPRPGDEVVVEWLSGLTLTVRPAERWELVRR
jgi:membrane-bound serine protease (ClpP class)